MTLDILSFIYMQQQLIFLCDFAPKIYDFLSEFSDLCSILMVSKDFYELRWRINWDKDYVNIDFIDHLDYYNLFTKVILPSTFFQKVGTRNQIKQNHLNYFDFFQITPEISTKSELLDKKLPKNAKKISFFDYVCIPKNKGKSFFWEPFLNPTCSYKMFNNWAQGHDIEKEVFVVENLSTIYLKILPNTLSNKASRLLYTLDNVEKIKFTSSMKGELTYKVLPKNLKTLILPNHYNKLFTSETFPKGLKKLHMGWVYPHELKPGDLPDGLEYLELNHNYDFPLKPNVFPKSITYLKLGTNTNKVIKPGVLHEGLKILELGSCYKQIFPKNTFPKSLEKIKHPSMFWDASVIDLIYSNNPSFNKK
jgi:hypothetical protein